MERHVKLFEEFINESNEVKILSDGPIDINFLNKDGERVAAYETKYGDYRVILVRNGREMDQPVIKGKRNAIAFGYHNSVAYINKDDKLFLDDKFKKSHPGFNYSVDKVKIKRQK